MLVTLITPVATALIEAFGSSLSCASSDFSCVIATTVKAVHQSTWVPREGIAG